MKILPQILAAIVLIAGCTKAPTRIILDTDIGSSTDDLVAMAMLYDYMEEGKAEVLGIMLDRKGDPFNRFTTFMNHWYNHDEIPVGEVENAPSNHKIYIDYSYLADSVVAKETIPATQLYRKLLSESPNKSVKVVSIGFLTNLAKLIESGPDSISRLSGKELVEKKVSALYIMGGSFSGRIIENYNMREDMASSQTVLSQWPTDIIFSTSDAGRMVDYQKDDVLTDLAADPGNPLALVYSNCTIDPGQKMWDALAVVHAVEGDSMFTMSPDGNVTLNENDHQTTFVPDPKGRFSYEMVDSTQALVLLKTLREHIARQ